jgi:hypothetical protein
MAAATLEAARAAKPAARRTFAALAEVVGVGITRVGDGYGVKVNLRAAPAEGVELPGEVEGVPVRVEVVGAIRKRQGP